VNKNRKLEIWFGGKNQGPKGSAGGWNGAVLASHPIWPSALRQRATNPSAHNQKWAAEIKEEKQILVQSWMKAWQEN
jgi:hypothetical protein